MIGIAITAEQAFAAIAVALPFGSADQATAAT
jgi:hypothetical protein